MATLEDMLFLLVVDCCHRMSFFYYIRIFSYLARVMPCLMKNQQDLHYPRITTNFFL